MKQPIDKTMGRECIDNDRNVIKQELFSFNSSLFLF